MKQSIKEYEQLLLDSHSTRKGATNAGAQGGLLQESCDGSRAECTSYSGMLAIPLEALPGILKSTTLALLRYNP